MRQLKVGLIGLGGIAQKVYLPLLSQAKHWQLVGAFTPNAEKNADLCRQYRITPFASLHELAQNCDVAFVHSATSTHFDVTQQLLNAGLHVYIDKPLADTYEQAEQLVTLAEQQKRTLMVGFNRRFAPFYQTVKAAIPTAASVRFEKHRMHGIANPVRFTLLDDYLHVVDTLLWLADGKAELITGQLSVSDQQEMIYAGHHFRHNHQLLSCAMHRDTGSNSETLELVGSQKILRVKEMNRLETESHGALTITQAGSWQTILESRGFAPMVEHFLTCVANQTTPDICGEQALIAQRLIEKQLLQTN